MKFSSRPLLFRILALILAPILVLVLLQLGAHVFGLGYSIAFWQRSALKEKPMALDNARFTWPEFGPRRARTANPMALEIPKEKGALRIFVLGGSAAQGDPDPSFSISRFLQCYLESTQPGRKLEVYNAAMTAVDSSVVARAAEDLVRLDPDLMIVYAGNNEFIGPSGLAAKSGFSRGLLQLKRSMMSYRPAQLLAGISWKRRAERGELSDWEGMETFTGLEIDPTDPTVDHIHRQFRSNLEKIVSAAGRRKIPVLLSTLAVNLSACPPFATSKNDKAEALLDEIGDLEKTGRLEEALRRLEDEKVDDAMLEYRRGRILRALASVGSGPENGLVRARQAFEKARDLDRLRFRADSAMNGIIRDVAAKAENVFLADVEKTFFEASPIPGDDLFYDHVHFNFAGTDLAAREIYRVMREEIPGLFLESLNGPMPERKRCASRMVFSGWSLLKIDAELRDRFSRPPFIKQFESKARLSRLDARMRRLGAYRSPAALEGIRKMMIGVLEAHPEDWILHYDLGLLLADMGHPDGAAVKMERVLELRPTFDRARRAQAELDLRLGQTGEAVKNFERVIRNHPWSVESLNGYGAALVAEKDPRAEEILERVLKLDPKNTRALYHQALFEAGRKKPERAKEILKKLLQIDPGDEAASRLLRKLVRDSG